MKKYFSFIKFSHTIFAMPFAIIGFFLAKQTTNSEFDLHKFILMILCMIFARNAAMAFNRYIDRTFDEQNPRTKTREIPSGKISPQAAILFILANILGFIASTWFINTICFYLSPIALVIILGYSYTKRFTALCHFILGLGLSLAPIGAYLVVAGSFNLLPILYSLAVLTWVSGFDIIYALQDEEFDRSLNLKSLPTFLGKKNALIFSSFIHILSAVFVIIPGFLLKAGLFYWLGVSVFIGMLIYQHRLVKPHDLSKVNLAFMTANGIASVTFALFYLLDLFLI